MNYIVQSVEIKIACFACLHVVKMDTVVKSYEPNLCSGKARQSVQTRFNSLCHNLQNNIENEQISKANKAKENEDSTVTHIFTIKRELFILKKYTFF